MQVDAIRSLLFSSSFSLLQDMLLGTFVDSNLEESKNNNMNLRTISENMQENARVLKLEEI